MKFSIEEEITKVALADIDINALAKKFKPLIMKRVDTSIKQYIKDLDIYEVLEDAGIYDYLNKQIEVYIKDKIKSL